MSDATAPANIVDKICSEHLVAEVVGTCLVHIDRIMMHDRGGGLTLREADRRRERRRATEWVFATVDHVVETLPGRTDRTSVPGRRDVHRRAARRGPRHGLRLFDIGDPGQGIVHVLSPEQGIALPGLTVVCNDSHTGTVGGLGALAWGGGDHRDGAGARHAVPLIERPRAMRVELAAQSSAGRTTKDLRPALDRRDRRRRRARSAGRVRRARGGADVGRGAPDDLQHGRRVLRAARLSSPPTTRRWYLARHGLRPRGRDWDAALGHWRALRSDDGAAYAATARHRLRRGCPAGGLGREPRAGRLGAPRWGRRLRRRRARPALHGPRPGAGDPRDPDRRRIHRVLHEQALRTPAAVLRGRKVADGVHAVCVPGSQSVKRQAEREGLDEVFVAAGFSWREPGCSMCFYAGGEGFGGKHVQLRDKAARLERPP